MARPQSRTASPANAGGRPAVGHKSMFAGLKIEGDDDDDESSEEEIVQKPASSKQQQKPVSTLDSLAQTAAHAGEAAKATVQEQVVAPTRRQERKLARQAAFKAAAALQGGSSSTPPTASSSEDDSSRAPSPAPAASAEAATPAAATAAAAVKEEAPKPVAKKESSSNSAKGGGLPHPFSPSNLPSLPTLPDPKKSVPSKRGASPDFPGSKSSDKKAVRFDTRTDAQQQQQQQQQQVPAVASVVKTAAAAVANVGKDSNELSEAELAKQKRIKDAGTRTASTLAMIAGFFAFLFLGHPYMILLVQICSTLVYKEVTALFSLSTAAGKKEGAESGDGTPGDRWSKTLNWYFFVVANYFLYGESIIYYFKHIVFIDAYFSVFVQNHRFISFMLYVLGFVAFVMNLQKPYLAQQFALFCWVHMTLLLIVVSSHFIMVNILEGLIWFFLPASLVICNDIWAYICGMTFGKTPLIKLSPKKTVEGFVGAFVCTIIFSIFWSSWLMRYDYMICPAKSLGTSAWSGTTCDPNPCFEWRSAVVPPAINDALRAAVGFALPAIPYAPFQLHAVVMACFASLFAPFGGFFASGFKRAFGVKDFGSVIPGHGGMTDRMDCQFLMGLFVYAYHNSFVRSSSITVTSVLAAAGGSLSTEDQLAVVRGLTELLARKGVTV